MRKKRVLITLIVLLGIALFYLQFSRKPTVNNVITAKDSTGYTSSVSITANKIIIVNYEQLRQSLISDLLNNNFDNILFSYDIMGYPKEYTITVYANSWTQKWDIPSFTFRYIPNV